MGHQSYHLLYQCLLNCCPFNKISPPLFPRHCTVVLKICLRIEGTSSKAVLPNPVQPFSGQTDIIRRKEIRTRGKSILGLVVVLGLLLFFISLTPWRFGRRVSPPLISSFYVGGRDGVYYFLVISEDCMSDGRKLI